MEITENQLATALEGFYLDVRTGTGTAVQAQVADADGFAEALYATLDRMAALRESDEDDDAEPDGPQVTGDLELSAMAAMVAAMDSLPDEGVYAIRGARWRALQYTAARYGFVLDTAE